MSGGFVLVVGPSGAGKDTLIGLARATLAGDPAFSFPKRLVTRPASIHEDHDTLDEAAFASAAATGRFALHWRAHGLGYALPATALDAARSGRVVVCNVSRRVVEEARRLLPNVVVVEITAPPELLARRLAARSRGEDGDLSARLARSAELGPVRANATVVNADAPEAAAAELAALLRRHAEACGARAWDRAEA